MIKVNNVSKSYKMYNKPIDRMKEALSISRKPYHHDFWALKDISFEVKKGENIGIIGTNGSGKSTLLKMITGVLTPTNGNIEVNGKISALLELGAGFNPEYTGIENIYLNGTMMGYSKEDMDEKVQGIVDFADIGEFVHQPVKTYSSGMFARLAFAVAINVEPEILIVDEALSVGDMRFQQKCFRKMEEFHGKNTIILVTHDMGALQKFSDKVLWIEKGKLVDFGKPDEICKKYRAYMQNSKLENIEEYNGDNVKLQAKSSLIKNICENAENFGDYKSKITGIGLIDMAKKENVDIVKPGQKIAIGIRFENRSILYGGIVGFTIRDRLGNTMFQSNSFILDEKIQEDIGEHESFFIFDIPELNLGKYTISPAIASGTQYEHIQHNWIYDAIEFEIVKEGIHELEGFLYLNEIVYSGYLGE